MNPLLFRIGKLLQFYFKAGNAHGLHSPFVFDLYTKAIRNKVGLQLEDIEKQRQAFLKNTESIDFQELGAGSQKILGDKRLIADIAKNSLSNQHKCALLYRIIQYLAPKYMLELGTSLGIATAYMARATKHQSFISIEGDPEVSKLAQTHLDNSIKVINAPFEEALPDVLEAMPQIDFAFIDGHHTKTATLEYFNAILAKANDYTCLIFDDIYWNEDMFEAWSTIASDSRIGISIDLFHFGLAFTRPFQPKQHFSLKTGFI